MKTKMLTLLAVAALAAGCSGGEEPADPPTSDAALTTSEATPVADPAPTTETPDDVSQTSAAPDVSETTVDSGPPELPPEAQEDSEAGAAAFAEHYIDMINYTSKYPEVGLLDKLSSENCEVCANFEDTVATSVETGEVSMKNIFEISETVSLYRAAESAADVRVTTHQNEQDIINTGGEAVEHIEPAEGVLAFSMSWNHAWTVDDLRIEVISP